MAMQTIKYGRGVTMKIRGNGSGYEFQRVMIEMDETFDTRKDTYDKAFSRLRGRVIAALVTDIIAIESNGQQAFLEMKANDVQRKYNLY
jgi:hypothetical protein